MGVGGGRVDRPIECHSALMTVYVVGDSHVMTITNDDKTIVGMYVHVHYVQTIPWLCCHHVIPSVSITYRQ
jgi:hypothetical protein